MQQIKQTNYNILEIQRSANSAGFFLKKNSEKIVISTTTNKQEQQQQTRQTSKTTSTSCWPGRLPKESTLNNNKQTNKQEQQQQQQDTESKQAKPQAQAADQVGHPRRVISAGSIVLIHCPIGLHHPLDAISCKWSSPNIFLYPTRPNFENHQVAQNIGYYPTFRANPIIGYTLNTRNTWHTRKYPTFLEIPDIPRNTREQSGRSCANGVCRKVWTWTKNFKPLHVLFCRDIMICRNLRVL